jgi:TrmH family RNA methyltransferase
MILNREIITSRKNPLVVWVASLSEKKFRDAEEVFVADGIKLFDEAVATGVPIRDVFLAESKCEQYLPRIEQALAIGSYDKTEVHLLSDACFEKISQEKSPQGVISVLKYLDKIQNIIKINKESDFIQNASKAVILASVRDPSNLGAILRSAAAFGTNTVMMSSDSADPYNAKVVRAAMGALFRLRLIRTPALSSAISALRQSGRRVFAAELKNGALPLGDISLTRTDVMVIGNEGHGIPGELSALCDGSVYLPISSGTESLNAAVAASIILWEQRD